MSKDEQIDGHVSLKQCKLAIAALHSYAQKKEQAQQDTELLPAKEQHIWLVVATKHMHPEKKLKPIKVPVAHPLVDPRTSAICLITKDPQREYKNLIQSHGIKFVSRVVGIQKLKGKWKPFEARRLLLKENDLFLADDRVIPLLPGLLGRKWFEAKKQPIPVCLTRKDLKAELERAISSTYMHQNQGTCTSVKVASLSHTPAQVLANIKMALPAIAANIKGGWDNIQSLMIKTSSSVSLPLWTCKLDDESGGRWDGLVAEAEEENLDGSDEEDNPEEDEGPADEKSRSQAVNEQKVAKGKKRLPESSDEKPHKKAKGPVSTSAGPERSPSAKAKGKRTVSVESESVIATADGKKKISGGKPSVSAIKGSSQAPDQGISDGSSTSISRHVSKPSTSKKRKDWEAVVVSGSDSSSPQVSKTDGKNGKQLEVTSSAKAYSAVAKTKEKKKLVDDTDSGENTVFLSSKPNVPAALPSLKKGRSTEDNSSKSHAQPSVSMKKHELQLKRHLAGGDKKKEKVVESKPGRKTKHAVLGKKAGRGL